MSRRYCDRYVCEECPYHSKYTDNLKVVMNEHSFDEIKNFLSKTYDLLTNLEINADGKFKKEYCCMMHYYNPNGIYDE
jgi:protein-arginine kinase activator protein McsA